MTAVIAMRPAALNDPSANSGFLPGIADSLIGACINRWVEILATSRTGPLIAA